MSSANRDTVRFILAAKQAEIETLEQLRATCAIVTCISDLIHQLQRERGSSNIFLGSQGQHFATQLGEQRQHSETQEQSLRQQLDRFYIDSPQAHANLRLLNSIALTLGLLDQLGNTRTEIQQRTLDGGDATEAFSRLIKALLGVVFEAADIASDPAITRVLVSLFNLMQGKEFAGQERAWGSLGFANGAFTPELYERIENLQDAQLRCFQVCNDYADDTHCQQWKTLEQSNNTQQLQQLRQVVKGLAQGTPVAPELSEVWFQCTTERIDQMRTLESELAQKLVNDCTARVSTASQELVDNRFQLDQLLASLNPSSKDSQAPLADSAQGEPLRPMYELIHHQSEYIKQIQQELTDARQALEERKLVERAKGVLMSSLGLSEQQAYAQMRQSAMKQQCSLAQVAQKLIATAEQLKPRKA